MEESLHEGADELIVKHHEGMRERDYEVMSLDTIMRGQLIQRIKRHTESSRVVAKFTELGLPRFHEAVSSYMDFEFGRPQTFQLADNLTSRLRTAPSDLYLMGFIQVCVS